MRKGNDGKVTEFSHTESRRLVKDDRQNLLISTPELRTTSATHNSVMFLS